MSKGDREASHGKQSQPEIRAAARLSIAVLLFAIIQ
jgi:hypothetical protein